MDARKEEEEGEGEEEEGEARANELKRHKFTSCVSLSPLAPLSENLRSRLPQLLPPSLEQRALPNPLLRRYRMSQ